MMKKALSILLVAVLLVFGALASAEQLPSPTLRTRIDAQAVAAENGAVAEDFVIWLDAEAEDVALLLEKLREFVETDALANYFGEESRLAAAEYLPQDFDMEAMMLAEAYSLNVENYVAEYGDVDASFEFSLSYEDEAVLLGMAGLAVEDLTEEQAENPAAEDLPEIAWTPVLAAAHEGRVILTLKQELLEQISLKGQALFVLLQQ